MNRFILCYIKKIFNEHWKYTAIFFLQDTARLLYRLKKLQNFNTFSPLTSYTSDTWYMCVVSSGLLLEVHTLPLLALENIEVTLLMLLLLLLLSINAPLSLPLLSIWKKSSSSKSKNSTRDGDKGGSILERSCGEGQRLRVGAEMVRGF